MRSLYIIAIMICMALISCKKDDTTPVNSSESGEGNGTGAEAGESGLLWNRADVANETINGINLILSFDEATETFKGTLENTNTNVAQQVRVEIHVFDAKNNSKEYGPTTLGDMQPGEKRNVILPVPNAGNFVKFQMHPEVGNSGSGESGEGSGS